MVKVKVTIDGSTFEHDCDECEYYNLIQSMEDAQISGEEFNPAEVLCKLANLGKEFKEVIIKSTIVDY